MAYTVDFTVAAEADLDKIIEWYNQFDVALANDFLKRMNTVIQDIAKNPLLTQKIYKSYRKSNISRFPYKLIYRVEKQAIIIIAITHHKRNAYWKKSR